MTLWIKKYIPKKTVGIRGQKQGIQQLIQFIQSYTSQKKKALIIHGPAGCGKTAAVYAVAAELHYELFEVNASDVRNTDQITNTVGEALKQRSLFHKGKIVLLDEIDGISGKKDRGGVSAIVKLLKKTNTPVIITANDPFHKKFSSLRKQATLVEFSPLTVSTVHAVLKLIADREKVCYDESALKSLARKQGGDLRGGINDLQTLSLFGTLDEKTVAEAGIREQEETIIPALRKIFKTTQPEVALGSFDYVAEDVDHCFLWVDENIPREYVKVTDRAAAYYYLSRADVFRRRIRRWQYWRFLVYVYQYLTVGIALSKDEKYVGFTEYKRTKRLLRIWQANMKYAKRKEIAQKIAERTHSSSKTILQCTLPYVQQLVKRDDHFALHFADEFDLDPDEMAWLKK